MKLSGPGLEAESGLTPLVAAEGDMHRFRMGLANPAMQGRKVALVRHTN